MAPGVAGARKQKLGRNHGVVGYFVKYWVETKEKSFSPSETPVRDYGRERMR